MAILGNGVVVGFTANLDYFQKSSQLFGNIDSASVLTGNAVVYRPSSNNAVTMGSVFQLAPTVTTYQTIANIQPMTSNIQSINSAVLKTNQSVSKEQIINTFSSKPNFKF